MIERNHVDILLSAWINDKNFIILRTKCFVCEPKMCIFNVNTSLREMFFYKVSNRCLISNLFLYP